MEEVIEKSYVVVLVISVIIVNEKLRRGRRSGKILVGFVGKKYVLRFLVDSIRVLRFRL